MTGPKRGLLIHDEPATVRELAAQGLRPCQIARRMNRTGSIIALNMTLMGLRKPLRRACIGPRYRTFSDEEDAFVLALRCQGYPVRQIGKLCGKRFGYERAESTLHTRLRLLIAMQEAA